MRYAVLGLIGLALASPALAASDPPKLTESAIDPIAAPYDEAADGHEQIDAAIKVAKRTHKRVLIDFGGNWCPDCRALAGVMQEPSVKSWLDRHYATVLLDVGRMKKNKDIAERYGITVTAVPTVIVATPDGKVLNATDNPAALSDARHLTPQAIVDVLARWTALPAQG